MRSVIKSVLASLLVFPLLLPAQPASGEQTNKAEAKEDRDEQVSDELIDWGEWADNQLSLQEPEAAPGLPTIYGVGIRGEDELLLNQLDRSAISVSGKEID